MTDYELITKFSWGYRIAEHEKEHPNCDCAAEQDRLLSNLPETASTSEVLDCLDAWEEEKRIREADRREWLSTLHRPDTSSSSSSDNGSPLFPAKWAGRCKQCGDRYQRWDSIGYVAGMAGPLCRTCHETHDDFTPYGY